MVVSLLVTSAIHWFSWGLVAFYCVLATVFIYGLLRPHNEVEWRNFGMATAWVVALYAEMYGAPLTLYVLAAIAGPHMSPGDDFQLGHVWAPLLRLESPYWNLLFTIVGNLLVATGAALTMIAWRHLWRQRDAMACDGLYARLRHPQYTGFFLLIFGSLVNWPTLPTLVMAPILVVAYYRLALSEERACVARFGETYIQYALRTPRFFPGIRCVWNTAVVGEHPVSPSSES